MGKKWHSVSLDEVEFVTEEELLEMPSGVGKGIREILETSNTWGRSPLGDFWVNYAHPNHINRESEDG